MTESNIIALINQELSRIIPPKGIGQDVVLCIDTIDGKEHVFKTNENGAFLRQVELMNSEMIKISELISMNTKTQLNSETNQFEHHTRTEFRYTYLPAASIVTMKYEFVGVTIEDANPVTSPENTDNENNENNEGE